MKARLFLITDRQIRELYRSGTAGSRNFERVIERVQRQEVNPEAVARHLGEIMARPKIEVEQP
jgi:hypothetical protein